MRLTFVVLSEISQQLLHGLPHIWVKTFMQNLNVSNILPNTVKTNDIPISFVFSAK